MGGNEIVNLKPFVEDDNINQVGHVIEFGYYHDQRGESKRISNNASSVNLSKDGSESMERNIDMENHKIANLGTPTNKDNIANKEYVETEISKVDNKNIQVLDGSKKMSKDLT